jgi:hypothetical protein
MLHTEDFMDDKETRVTVAATRVMLMRLESLISDKPLERDLRLSFAHVQDYLTMLMSPIDHASGVSYPADRLNYGLLALDAEVEAYRGVIDELKHEGDYEL